MSRGELAALEEARKERAAQAVAALEATEAQAVQEAIAVLQSGNTSTPGAPGLLGEVLIQSDVGHVKVALLSSESVATNDGAATIDAGNDTGEMGGKITGGPLIEKTHLLIIRDDSSCLCIFDHLDRLK